MTVKKKVDKMLSHFVTPPFSLFLFAGFFQLLLSGAFKVFIELLTEIRKRRYRILLAAVRRNLIGI